MLSITTLRVREIFKVQDPPPPSNGDRIKLVFIDHRSCQLQNQTEMFKELGDRYPHA